MPLTDTAIRNAKPTDKPLKKFDERGLFLLVAPSGGKWWRLRYKFDGKEKLLSLGVYPDVGLKDARGRRDDARKLLADGIDPGQNRKATKSARMDRAANSFEAVTREWFTKYSATWAANHGNRIIRRFERDIFPCVGAELKLSHCADSIMSQGWKPNLLGSAVDKCRVLFACLSSFLVGSEFVWG